MYYCTSDTFYHHRTNRFHSAVFSSANLCLVLLLLGPGPAHSRLLKSCSSGGPAPDYRHSVRDNWDVVSRLFGKYLGWSPTPDSGRQLKKAIMELSDVPDDGVRDALDFINDDYREKYFAWLRKCQPQTLGR